MDSADDIFLIAREIEDQVERAAYLANACGDADELRARVEALLLDAEAAEDFFGAEEARASVGEALSTEKPGTVIGRYKLLEKIGEGGMGVVYMAEQQKPVHRKVALKIIKMGMDTRQVVARFEAERQALAMMDHPHIASVLDAGANDSGRPYFVMELVEGVPITQFCEANKFSMQERLKLFMAVCHAIQSAHQKGVIHRDIKPSNVLVTMHEGEPHPMVIDFGVARAINQKLTERTLFTNFGTMIGTPAYMSPEQAEMSKLDVDTRSDIYSLGVLLYELLTGTTPFPEERLRSVGYGEMQRIIAEERPERPSTRLRRKLAMAERTKSQILKPKSTIPNDLDWIVMKCLEKDRNRRYATANGLASDIKRYLDTEPVLARPPSRLYEFQKTVRRHKFGFAATAAVLVTLAGGVALSSWQAVRAKRAEHEQAKLREKAERAEGQRTEELGRSLLAFAQARRQSGVPGQRFDSLEAIGRAAAISRPLDLRNEAIAALALTDLGKPQVWRASVFTNGWNWDGNHDFDPDLERYAVGRPDKSITICRVADRQELFRLPAASTEGRGVIFSPDGKWLAVRHDDDWLRVWDLEGRVKTLEAKLDGKPSWSLAFSPDSRRVVAGSTSNLVHWFDVATGVETNSLRVSVSPERLLFDPAGKVLAAHDGTRCELWDWEQGKLMNTFSPPGSPPFRENPLTAWAWHPDGIRFACGSNADQVYLCDSRTGSYQVLNQPSTYVAHLCFSPRGDLLVSYGWDSTTRVWDAHTGRPILSTEAGYALRFSGDGERLAFFRDNGELGVWPVASSRIFRTLSMRVQHRAAFGGCSFSSDGLFLLWGQADGLRWVNLVSGEVDFQEVANVIACGFGPGGSSFLTANKGSVLRWPVSREENDTSSRLRIGTPTPIHTESGQILRRVAFSKDGQTMVGGTKSNWFVVELGKVERVFKYPAPFNSDHCFLLSPDNRWVGLGFWNASAFVCDARSGEAVKEFPDVRTGMMAFTPDGRWLVTCSQQEYRFWESGTWRPGLVIKRELASSANGAIAMEPQGRLVAIARTAYLVQLLNPNNGEVVADLAAPDPMEVHRLCFSPDGSLLAVTGMQGIHLWDLREMRRELAALNLDWNFPPYPPSTFSIAKTLFHAPSD